MRYPTYDAQAALGFLISQVSYIEPGVYETRYPDIQYDRLIPMDYSAPEWAKSVTFFSMDRAGEADWFHAAATDLRLADVERNKFEKGIEMAGIGYRYNLEELGQAMMIPGTNLTADKANAARRAAEEFIDTRLLRGDTRKNWTGLYNDAGVTASDAIADGTGASALWSTKTGDQIARDISDALTGVYTGSNTVEMADTIILPVASLSLISTKRMNATGTDISVLEWIKRYNVYTQITGNPLTIAAGRGLEIMGDGGTTGRMVVYRKDPQVLKAHMPMRHRFMPVWQTGPLTFDVPGIFRFGGLEIRLPKAVRYIDGIQ